MWFRSPLDSVKTRPGRATSHEARRPAVRPAGFRPRDGPAAILKDFAGFLQADAANVFDGLYLPGSITEVGCWAHARRHFHEARDSDAVRSAEAHSPVLCD